MKKIKLTGKYGDGKYALVDDEDFKRVSRYKWYLGSGGYVKHSHILMHRFILGVSSFVDHINENKLDNRKENLRIATVSQNQFNRGIPINNSTGYKGVHHPKSRVHLDKPYQANIRVNQKTIYLGIFATAEEAALAYNNAALKYVGEFAKLNALIEYPRKYRCNGGVKPHFPTAHKNSKATNDVDIVINGNDSSTEQ